MHELTIVIVTHNMQQAQRVSHSARCSSWAVKVSPGRIVETGPTAQVFERSRRPRTADYVHGRFG